MNAADLDQIMVHWRAVIRATEGGGDPWSRGFALNMQRLARRPSWRLSPKQAALMRQAVAELFADADGETVLIERG